MTTYAQHIMKPTALVVTKHIAFDLSAHVRHAEECLRTGAAQDHLTYNQSGQTVVDKSFRNSKTMIPHEDMDLMLHVIDEVRAYASEYFDLDPTDEIVATGNELFSYPPGVGIQMHFDDHVVNAAGEKIADDSYRGITSIVYLNEEYEGGELVFPRQNTTIKPTTGLLVLFPSNNEFPHAVNPITSGMRYSYQRTFGIICGKTNQLTV